MLEKRIEKVKRRVITCRDVLKLHMRKGEIPEWVYQFDYLRADDSSDGEQSSAQQG